MAGCLCVLAAWLRRAIAAQVSCSNSADVRILHITYVPDQAGATALCQQQASRLGQAYLCVASSSWTSTTTQTVVFQQSCCKCCRLRCGVRMLYSSCSFKAAKPFAFRWRWTRGELLLPKQHNINFDMLTVSCLKTVTSAAARLSTFNDL
ncbi:hypothetical protein COO60DRAFT_725788 [Scenedesmus sp. NREL 46B-D3]|nr:hypothetical protein COO60DRAFT_725788 [Scenedesmus sp. NREL 46B-D3]